MNEKLNAIIVQNKAIINLCQTILYVLGVPVDKINEVTNNIRTSIVEEELDEKGENNDK